MHDVPAAAVAALFAPERPGPMIHAHIAATGVGGCRADRATDPRTALGALPGGNVACRGEPVVIPGLTGLVEAPPAWVPVLRAEARVGVWDWIVAVLPDAADPAPGHPVRRLVAADAAALEGLDPSIAWISETWGGHAGPAASGTAWAAIADDRIVAVAAAFFVGRAYEDVGVVTQLDHQPGQRRQPRYRRAAGLRARARRRAVRGGRGGPDRVGAAAAARLLIPPWILASLHCGVDPGGQA